MGAFFTLCHDVIIMNSDRGWWCLNEIWIGSLFPEIFKELIRSNITNVFKYSDTPVIPDLFYFARLKLPSGPVSHQAAVLGHRFTAAEALDSRIVRAVSSRSHLLQRSKDFAKDMLKRGAYGRDILRSMKEDIYESLGKISEKAIHVAKF